MLLERRPEKDGISALGLAERKVDRRRAGRDPVEQLGEARERRGDEIVESVVALCARSPCGRCYGMAALAAMASGIPKEMSPGESAGAQGRAEVKGGGDFARG